MNEMIFVHAYTIETEENIFGQKRQIQIPKGDQHLFDEVKVNGKKERSAYALCGLAAADIGEVVKELQKRIYLPICKDCERVFKTRNNSAWKKWTNAAAPTSNDADGQTPPRIS